MPVWALTLFVILVFVWYFLVLFNEWRYRDRDPLWETYARLGRSPPKEPRYPGVEYPD
jgi:hypothetical protein